MNMDFNPTTIMSDFEPALAEAINSEVRVVAHLNEYKSYFV
jgi:hypothetical protein